MPRRAHFNGATARMPWKIAAQAIAREQRLMLQWGHGSNAVEHNVSVGGTGRPRSGLQWGHGSNAVELGELPCSAWGFDNFNGATARMPWNLSQRNGPRPRPCYFNGATARMPWKIADTQSPSTSLPQLQCGHGSNAVEDPGGRCCRASVAVHASMGPRLECRGRSNDRLGIMIAAELQWGHGLKPWKILLP